MLTGGLRFAKNIHSVGDGQESMAYLIRSQNVCSKSIATGYVHDFVLLRDGTSLGILMTG